MALNYIEIDKVIDELSLEGSELQNVKAASYESFTFFFYKPNHPINVLISLDKYCRIHRQTLKTNYLGKTHNLVEYLKAYVTGGKVIKCTQLNNNRLIQLQIEKPDEHYYIFIRLWGGFSNIIITDPNYKILHLHKKSSKKAELPGEIFKIPPPKKNETKEYKLKEYSGTDYNLFIEKSYIKEISETNESKKQEQTETYKVKRLKEINKQLKSLEKRYKSYKKSNIYKLYGDLILSNIHLIKKGSTILQTEDYSGHPLEITLDPEISPAKNSQSYYKKHQKAESGLEITEEMIKKLQIEKENIDDNVNILEQPIVKQKPKSQIGLNYTIKEWDFLVGRNAKENDKLLRNSVKGNDMWFHVRDYPGGYVFIKNQKGKTIPLEIIEEAGKLALFYSKGKSNGKADITYTQVKHLRRVKKGKLGQVIVTMDKNIYVTLNKNILY
ncbi:MAG: NFACT RNA binding domain-containing protein [Spirochaetaceae bacterium]